MEIPEGGGILEIAEETNLFPDLPMESFPNRDSVKYREVYSIPEASTIIRSTLRYRGFCGIALGLLKLGLLKDTEHQRLRPDAAPLRWVRAVLLDLDLVLRVNSTLTRVQCSTNSCSGGGGGWG